MPGCQRCSRSLTAAHGLWAVTSLTQRHMGRSQFADSGTWAADGDVSGHVPLFSGAAASAHGPLTARSVAHVALSAVQPLTDSGTWATDSEDSGPCDPCSRSSQRHMGR
nr:hypothetical protein Itr_chr05CG15660 [Ipomoea trifida]